MYFKDFFSLGNFSQIYLATFGPLQGRLFLFYSPAQSVYRKPLKRPLKAQGAVLQLWPSSSPKAQFCRSSVTDTCPQYQGSIHQIKRITFVAMVPREIYKYVIS